MKTPAERSLYKTVVDKYGLNINKAQTSSKFFNYIVERLAQEPEDKTMSPHDVSIMVRDGISRYCLSVNVDRESLLQQLHLVEEAIKPLAGHIENAKETANIKSMLSGLTFVSVICM